MKYAVAYMNFFDNDLKMTQVEADNPIEAIAKGMDKLIWNADESTSQWINDITADVPSSDGYDKKIEAIKQEFIDADTVIEVMSIDADKPV